MINASNIMKQPPRTWTHNTLGAFEFSGVWTGTVHVPGFNAFRYDPGYKDVGPPTGVYELRFEAADEQDVPSETAISLALNVLQNQASLVSAVCDALWEDFNGRGPDSGMWWHRGRSEFEDDETFPEGAEDFLRLMRLSGIEVRKNANGYNAPVAELCFWAEFEQEHNVGVLTDGEVILGTGYQWDVSVFNSYRASAKN